jgi:hypothetical protein
MQCRISMLILLSAVLSIGAARAEDTGGWQTNAEERGILVSTREEPGRDLPSFRGQAKVQAPVLHLLAILLDDARSGEWAKGADETRILRTVDAHTQIVYARARQPWPVKDRDVVMKRTVDVLKPGEVFRVHLTCVPREKPPVPGVVRVQTCETTFVLRAIDAATTSIDYRVNADPGGENPAWIVKMASKNIPLDTLSALRKQVERTRGRYDEAVAVLARAI